MRKQLNVSHPDPYPDATPVRIANTPVTAKNGAATYTTPTHQGGSGSEPSSSGNQVVATNRTSGRYVVGVKNKLKLKEMQALRVVVAHRAMLTEQIVRILLGSKNPNNMRTALRWLARLRDLKLIRSRNYIKKLDMSGAVTMVWQPTKLGVVIGSPDELLNQDGKPKLTINNDAQDFKLQHILEVNEIEAVLRDLGRDNPNFVLRRVEHEPLCWRKTADRYGSAFWLRADLFIEVAWTSDNITRLIHYFIELDRGTEEPKRLVHKCEVYLSYLTNSTKDDWCCGALPLVVWVVPDDKRKATLIARIAEKFGGKAKNLFSVTVPAELIDHMTNWQNVTKIGGQNE